MPGIEPLSFSRSFCVQGQVATWLFSLCPWGRHWAYDKSPPAQDLGRRRARCPPPSCRLHAWPCRFGGLALPQGEPHMEGTFGPPAAESCSSILEDTKNLFKRETLLY